MLSKAELVTHAIQACSAKRKAEVAPRSAMLSTHAQKKCSDLCGHEMGDKMEDVDGERMTKCHLTMRGFKDAVLGMETFAGAASRWGQRMFNSVCAQEGDVVYYSHSTFHPPSRKA